jgi:uncharacterized protein DUF4430
MMSATRPNSQLSWLPLLLAIASWAQAPKANLNAVRLVIDFGDGVQKQFVLPWKQDMTVFDTMNLAQANPHGIKFAYAGSTPHEYFLTQIDDVKNEGSGSGKRNWLYSVNTIPAKEGFGIYKLKATAKVSWKFSASHLKTKAREKSEASAGRLTWRLAERKTTALLLLVLFENLIGNPV